MRSHNEVCGELAALATESENDSSLSFSGIGEQPSAATLAASKAAAVALQDSALAVHAQTPQGLLRRRLITYSQDRDLLPLLFEFSKQSLDGDCTDLDYDYGGLESALAGRLLSGKRPLALQVRHYLYAGEARARGGLAALQALVPQAPALPAAVADALRGELDTREQVVMLLGLLEEAFPLQSILML